MRPEALQKIITKARKYSDNKNDPEFFNILIQAIQKVPRLKNQPPFLEIGTRRGGTALLMLETIRKMFRNTVLITVDPYGDKPYDDKPYQYGNRFYCDMKRLLASYPNHIHYHLTSQEFINIRGMISYWFRGQRRDFSEFSFIYLDGSHIPATVKMEFKHLFPRLIKGGCMVVDNTDFYKGTMAKFFEKKRHTSGIEAIAYGQQTLTRKV